MRPLAVQITRGGRVESEHAVAAAVADADGAVLLVAGDDRPVFPRSAIKAFLAIPLVASGGADAIGLDEQALALACASHAGEPPHLACVRAMLDAARVPETALVCGTHPPLSRRSADALIRDGVAPCPLHNNCSGKHAGLIALARSTGAPVDGYERPDHPAMREAVASLARLTGYPCDERNRATDGCSIPTHAVPLARLAAAMARFCTGHGLAAADREASRRLRRAVARHPVLLAGTGRFDTRLTERFGERLFIKGGAEGVWCAGLPEAGLGIAVKALDGAGRAAEAAIAFILARHLGPDECLDWPGPIRTWRGETVGGTVVGFKT